MQSVLLLHGAIGSADQLDLLKDQLSDNYNVHTLNFSGHGGEKVSDDVFSIPLFAEEANAYIEKKQLSQVSVFGYSMGGYVAMYLAKKYPEKITSIITLATKFYWDKEVAAKEMQQLDPEKIASRVPAFAAALEKRHAPNDWKQLVEKTALMLEGLGSDNVLQLADYMAIEIPCLLLLGDRDKMITLEETIAVYKNLPQAQMGMLPNTPHPIEQVNMEILSEMIRYFLK